MFYGYLTASSTFSCLSVSLSMCLQLFAFLEPYLSPSLENCISLCLFLCFSFCLSIRHFVCLYPGPILLVVCFIHCLSKSVSISLFLLICLSVCLSLSLSMWLYPSRILLPPFLRTPSPSFLPLNLSSFSLYSSFLSLSLPVLPTFSHSLSILPPFYHISPLTQTKTK